MPIDGIWELTIYAPTGAHGGTLRLSAQDPHLRGEVLGRDGDLPIQHGEIIGGVDLSWTIDTPAPASITLQFSAVAVGDQMMGEVELGDFGTATFVARFLGPWDDNVWGMIAGDRCVLRSAAEPDPG